MREPDEHQSLGAVLKAWFRSGKNRVILGVIVSGLALVAVLLIFASGSGSTGAAEVDGVAVEPAPVATPVVVKATGNVEELEPTPTATPEPPTPTPTPTIWAAMVPLRQQSYREYRFYHFVEEYYQCFGTPSPVEVDTDPPAETPEAPASVERRMEARILADWPLGVKRLLDAYSEGVCAERSDFGVYAGRLVWLRHHTMSGAQN